MASGHSASRQLADWCAGLAWRDIPEAVRAHLPLRLLDTVGLIQVGAETAAGKAAIAQALASGGAAQSTVCSAEVKLPAAAAAMVHGTAAHCRDFDDTYVDSVVHPGSVVLPAALAVAESLSASNEDFGAAVIAGYEVAARIGAVAGRRFHARHLHATGVVGPLAAAATAGRLMRLSGEQISWAMGLTASMSGGLMAFQADGGWSKWLHAGWAAHGGIVAAELASRGFRGPEHVLDGGMDLYSALLHGEEIDRGILTAELGRRWQGALAEFKYYPCAHVIQPYIDTVIELVTRHDLRAADVASIECAIAPWAAAIVAEPREAKLRFDSELEAIASLPYQLAVAVAERGVDLRALEAGQRARPDIAALAQRITHRNDPDLGRTFDGSVRLRTASGAEHVQAAVTAGIDAAKLEAKFVRNVAPVIAKHRNATTDSAQAAARAAAKSLLAPGTPDWRRAAAILADVGSIST
jgi:2-methylcitrate dehydratase PrpD